MPFDLTPLTVRQLFLFLISFIAVFAIASNWNLKGFRVPKKNIYFAGLMPAVVIAVLTLLILKNLALGLGLIIATLLIIFIGRIDEKNRLTASAQLFWQIVVALVLVMFGWVIPHVSNPIGEGVLYLGVLGLPLTLAWIVLTINAVNWFDGLDGLASSVSVIAFLALATISLLPATQDATTLSLALIGAGAMLGFLLLNAPPARIYLGTIGSWFLGSYLAITAIIGGGKVATAALVLAIPLLDLLFVIIQRIAKKQRPWMGDTKHHLFHRLAAAGFTPRQIVLIISIATAVLGFSAVTLQTTQKLLTFVILAIALAAVVILLAYVSRRRALTQR